jgi:hypothetical protein
MVIERDPVLSIIYTSISTEPFDDDDLLALLDASRRNNADAGLTGMLLYRDGRFFQVIEGPEEALRARMETISADPRHTRVQVLFEETLGARRFPDWSMGFVPREAAAPEGVPGYLESFGEAAGSSDASSIAYASTDPAGTRTPPARLRALLRWFDDTANRPA